jgi:hypothetical protein
MQSLLNFLRAAAPSMYIVAGVRIAGDEFVRDSQRNERFTKVVAFDEARGRPVSALDRALVAVGPVAPVCAAVFNVALWPAVVVSNVR